MNIPEKFCFSLLVGMFFANALAGEVLVSEDLSYLYPTDGLGDIYLDGSFLPVSVTLDRRKIGWGTTNYSAINDASITVYNLDVHREGGVDFNVLSENNSNITLGDIKIIGTSEMTSRFAASVHPNSLLVTGKVSLESAEAKPSSLYIYSNGGVAQLLEVEANRHNTTNIFVYGGGVVATGALNLSDKEVNFISIGLDPAITGGGDRDLYGRLYVGYLSSEEIESFDGYWPAPNSPPIVVEAPTMSGRYWIVANTGGYLMDAKFGDVTINAGSHFNIKSPTGKLDRYDRNSLIHGSPSASVGKVVFEGNSSISIDGHDGFVLPGKFTPVIVAGSISVGQRYTHELNAYIVGGEAFSAIGNVDFVTRYQNGITYLPEVIRESCGAFCSEDVLGVRAVRVLRQSARDAFDFPKVLDPESAVSFISGDHFQTAINASQIAYTDGARVRPDMPDGHISQTTAGGLYSFAEVFRYSSGSDISIVIRGTDEAFDLLSNVGFLSPEASVIQRDIHNIASFISTVVTANPGSKFRLAGHSLGGGLASFFGLVTGFETLAFNAPDVSRLMQLANTDEFQSEYGHLFDLASRDSGDFSHIVSVKTIGDPVSGTRLGLGQRYGQEITVSNKNSDLLRFLMEVETDAVKKIEFAYNFHRIGFLIDQATGLSEDDIYEIVQDGDVVYRRDNKSRDEMIAAAAAQIVFPRVAEHTRAWFRHPVRSGLFYIIDPAPTKEFVFSFDDESVRIDRLFLPDIPDIEELYSIYLGDGEDWWLWGDFSAGDMVLLPSAYRSFKLHSSIDLSNFFGEGQFFFVATFSGDGVYSGNIATIPEPPSVLFFGVGLAVISLFLRCRRGVASVQ